MKMSGTFLETVNSGIRRLASGPLATNRAWAESHREFTKQKNLASGNVYTPTLRLRQFLANRRISREEGIKEYSETVKNRGLAYNATRNYKDGNLDGVLSRRGRRSYEAQARNMRYQGTLLRHNNNMNKGFGQRATEGSLEHFRLNSLDMQNVVASDLLKAEQARGERIEYENAVGFHQRMEAAINAHMDNIHGELRDKEGKLIYKGHFDNQAEFKSALERYGDLQKVMEGNLQDVQYVAATAAQAYDTQAKIIMTKYQKYFELTPPTKDVEFRLGELTKQFAEGEKVADRIDAIIPGLRILNQRGDTDLVREQLENVLNNGYGIDLGTHASQSLASFLMFEVKDNDPFLRRFGKYINLETAQVYNKATKRQNTHLTLNEYITGEYEDWEPVDEAAPDAPRRPRQGKSKRSAAVLLEGTSLDNVERTAYNNLDDMLVNAYTKDGKLDEEKYFAKRKEIETAIGPQFISASLKYLSGSEQLQNAVSFLTGYRGTTPRWEAPDDVLYGSEMAEDYFRSRALGYIKDQTPSQILGMRSDYRDAMMEHLSAAYFSENPEEKEKFDREVAGIQTRYGEDDVETATRKRAADVKKLKMEKAGMQIRKVLGETGKLEQIYRTRRSGAANNAKDWLRGWVNLDNENALRKEVDFYREKQEEEWREEMRKRKEADPNFEYDEPHRIYDESDQLRFDAEMSKINEEYSDGSVEDFFEITRDKLEEWFPGDFIVWSYEKYYANNKYATNDDLYSWIKDVLGNLDQYPGNRDAK